MGHRRHWLQSGITWGLVALLIPPTFVELVLAVSPAPAIYLAYAGASALLLWAYNPGRRRALKLALAVLTATLLCLSLVPWNSRKAFLRDFRQVEPGTSLDEVNALLQTYEFNERRMDDGAIERIYSHNRAGRFDSDWGIVRVQDERVASTQFLPD